MRPAIIEISDQYSIPTDHPSLPGHFPGKPVVPGVVILNTVFQAINQHYPDRAINGIRKLKFLKPMAPGQGFVLSCGEIKNNGIRFNCLLADNNTIVAEGHLSLHAMED